MIPTDSPASNKPPCERVAQLIGKRCLLKCIMNGHAVTALFDKGAQVSLINQTWKQKCVPHQEVRPLSELMGECDLKVLATK